jgi:MoaA/NifB/PqqE/SkfB family radical SAM enzyme
MAEMKRTAQWHRQAVNGGVLSFDRMSGTNVLLRNRATHCLRRRAPRVLQIGLLTSCNLDCGYCYRDRHAPNRLDAEFLFDLLRRAADWGVLEVAFGGGEPLLYPGFVELVRQLHDQTPLGVNVTTNGTLLTPEIVGQLTPSVGEIRLSAHRDNHYRRSLRMLAGHNVGVNLLVTPGNVGLVEPFVRDLLALGANNVLLLGYKGQEHSLHLQWGHLETLKRAVFKMQYLPLRLDGCWYPLLPDLPHLFPREDCGAGDEFLVITPDRAVQPCSFHHQRIPFETFEELQAIYGDLRARREKASIPGCKRPLFIDLPSDGLPAAPGRWVWHARASNNSGDWTIVGRFQTTEEAQQAAESLRELARAHEAFLASPEGQQWLKGHGYDGSLPTPPLRLFGQEHGFDWTGENDGLCWEEDGCGAPVLTAGAVGNAIVIYHPYCGGLPERPFREFFAKVGAVEFGYWQYDRPAVVATARGNNPVAMEALAEYLARIDAAEHASDVDTPPPWGNGCQDPRVCSDEDCSARLARGLAEIQQDEDQLRVAVTFENTFAGSLALANWLTAMGYEDITLEIDDVLEGLTGAGQTKASPKCGLFGDVRPLTERLEGAPPEKIVELTFAYESQQPAELAEALEAVPANLRMHLCQTYWASAHEAGRDVTRQALLIIQNLGSIAAEWMRAVWQVLIAENRHSIGFATKALAASLPPDEAFDLAQSWVEAAPERTTQADRLMALGNLRNRRTLTLIEQWWGSAEPGLAVTAGWGRLTAESQLTWDVVASWLQRGRPLSLVALDALLNYSKRPGYPNTIARPMDFGLHDVNAFRDELIRYRGRDSAPRVSRTVEWLIESAEDILN